MGQLSGYAQKFSQETFSSLRIRNYRLFYIGQIISTSGTFMQSVAQSWLVLQLTNSGAALGITTALQSIPILLLGPYGGVIADRVSKRKIFFFTQSIASILAIILGILVATNLVQVWMVYILAFCLGLVNAFDNPTRQTFHIELVGPEHLRNAVTLYSILINLARIIGPAIAGALIASVGLAPCFFINGLSYMAVVVMLSMMRTSEMFITPPVPRAKGQIQEGFKYVVSTPVIWAILLMMAIIGMFTYEFQVTLPLIAQDIFNGDARSYAFLTASMGFGAATGGHFLRRPQRAHHQKTGQRHDAVRAGGAGDGLHAKPAADRYGHGAGGNRLDQLLLDRQQHAAAGQLAADARAGDVFLDDGLPGHHHHRRADRGLVCRNSRTALGPGLGGLAGMAAAVIGGLALRKAQSPQAHCRQDDKPVEGGKFARRPIPLVRDLLRRLPHFFKGQKQIRRPRREVPRLMGAGRSK